MTLRLLRFADPAAAANAATEAPARILGGGTLLVRDVNMGNVAIETLVRLDEPGGRVISIKGGDKPSAQLGGQVTMAQVLRCTDLAWLAPVARSIGGPAVRSMATVAGNLHAPSPYGDFAAALLALDAQVSLHDGQGDIEVPLADFLAKRTGAYARRPIRAVRFTSPAPGSFGYRKVTRTKPKGIAVLTIAAVLETDAGGALQDVRVAYGAMAPTPVRSPSVEAALAGRTLSADTIAAAVAVAVNDVAPADDPIASAWYRKEVLPVHLRRMLAGETA